MSEEEARLARARALVAIDERDALSLVGADGSIRRLEGASAELARVVLGFCAIAARTRAEIVAHVEERAGERLLDASVIDALLALLGQAGALVPARPVARSASSGARVLVCLGGAVASAHAPALILRLQALGHDVRVVATENALQFVAKDTLEALTHRAVFSSMRQRDEGVRVPHIELAAWPDVVLVWPATAALVHRVATGDCSELASAIAITTRAPVLVAPSMNTAMLEAPSVQRNLEALRRDGFALVPPALAIEVADAPAERAPALGGAPGPAELAALVQAHLRLHGSRAPALPRDPAGWEALHRGVPEQQQAWFTDAIDPQIARAIEAHAAPPGLLWDVGTGHGATARWAAERGFFVIASDVSETALERARARAGSARIAFVVDDVTLSALRIEADVVIDRGTLHSLPPARREAWARALIERTRPGAIAVVKVHAPPGGPRVASHPVSKEELLALLGPAFALVHEERGTFDGALDPPPPAALYVLCRG